MAPAERDQAPASDPFSDLADEQTRSSPPDGAEHGIPFDEADDDQVRDQCGIVGVVSTDPAAPLAFYALRALQHRGQEAAGIATMNGKIHVARGGGLVDTAFNPETLGKLEGVAGIGHVRYSTTGGSALENAQPIVVAGGAGEIALAHNGDIVNSGQLREELQAQGWGFLTTSDTEVATRILSHEFTRNPTNHVRAIRDTMVRLTGSYCFVILHGDTVYAVRDPLGIKPLCYGRLPDGGHVVASESTALNVLDATLIRDVEPGEILEVTKEGVKTHRPGGPTLNIIHEGHAHCMFEYVYFARADSVMDTRDVYNVRVGIGKRLWEGSPVEADVVVPVPDSGRTHALGFSYASGIPFSEGLMKNRYVHRTFIMPDQRARDLGVRTKLNAVKSVVDGKRVVLIDDSIVRGTTMRRIIRMLRATGAKEVHVRIGSPPIIAPCYLGIDMNTRRELVAAEMSVKEIQEHIGADSLAYLPVEGLVESIGLPRKDLCLGCVTGEYPVEIPGEKHRFQRKIEEF